MTAYSKPKITLQEAFLKLKSPDEVNRFLLDVCTPAEIEALSQRWWVAQLLDEKKLSYREIHDISKASVTTVTRVARFLQHERHRGYRIVLDRSQKSNRTS
jgi:TrpR-related protein YerC/YecD